MQDAVEVFEQIKRAVRTLRKLPPVTVKSRFCNWPEIVRSFYEAYGYTEATMPKVVPTARQLSELDQVIGWLAWLSRYGDEYPKIIWARAENYSLRRISRQVGLNKDTCKERFLEGLIALHHAINQHAVNK